MEKKKLPRWIAPMLATLTEEYFSHKDWIFEKKFDGVRCIAIKRGDKVELYSRNQKSLNHMFPELIPSLKAQKCHSFVIDGEIAAIGEKASFSSLQKRLHVKNVKNIKGEKVKVALYVFDLLHLEGHDLVKVPLIERKSLLKKALQFKRDIIFTTHKKLEGEKYLKEACKKGWEGLIAKRAQSLYVSKRSKDWLKFKCDIGQEFIICGYTDPAGSRKGFGALLIGYYEKNALHFAGKVGTGYDEALLLSLSKRLKKLERKISPFKEEEIRMKGVHWVNPTLVCEVKFTEWTKDGRLRHPRFLGLRIDKKARDVRREKK